MKAILITMPVMKKKINSEMFALTKNSAISRNINKDLYGTLFSESCGSGNYGEGTEPWKAPGSS